MNSIIKTANPSNIREPFGHYVHGILVPEGCGLVMTSGQLGTSKEDATPESVAEQCEICFSNIASILNELGSGMNEIVKVSAYLTDRKDFPAYMRVRDKYIGQAVCSTLLIVGGFTRPEFKVEVEVMALSHSSNND